MKCARSSNIFEGKESTVSIIESTRDSSIARKAGTTPPMHDDVSRSPFSDLATDPYGRHNQHLGYPFPLLRFDTLGVSEEILWISLCLDLLQSRQIPPPILFLGVR